MSATKTTVANGLITFKAPEGLADGTEVLVDVVPLPWGKIGLDESEWRDDPAALADWDAWLPTIEPFELTPEEEERFRAFDSEFRKFNIEAVRKQMEEGLAS